MKSVVRSGVVAAALVAVCAAVTLASCSSPEHIHDYLTAVQAPTCTEVGFTVHQCRADGVTYFDDYTDALGHDFADGKCTRCQVNLPDLADLTFTLKEDGSFSVSSANRGVTAVDIPSEYGGVAVTSVAENAFIGCDKLQCITLPDSVTDIGGAAFSGCKELTSVAIPAGVTHIGANAFVLCQSLTGVYITDIAAWCNIAFDVPTSVGTEGLSNPLYYAHNLFLGGRHVTELTVPASAGRVGGYAFAHCARLTSVTLEEGVAEVGSYAFALCPNLKRVTLADGTQKLYDHAFAQSGIESIDIPDGMTAIHEEAFADCNALAEINASERNGAYSSVGGVLYNKDKTKIIRYPSAGADRKYTLPDSVRTVGAGAFAHCNRIYEITLPVGVTKVGAQAFFQCGNLTSIVYGGTKEQWNAVQKGADWDASAGDYTVSCMDGEIKK